MLLDSGTIKVTGQRDGYNEVDMIEFCLAEEESDDEYASADEFFSSYEDLFSRDDSVMTDCVEDGVNVIVPFFGAPRREKCERLSRTEDDAFSLFILESYFVSLRGMI